MSESSQYSLVQAESNVGLNPKHMYLEENDEIHLKRRLLRQPFIFLANSSKIQKEQQQQLQFEKASPFRKQEKHGKVVLKIVDSTRQEYLYVMRMMNYLRVHYHISPYFYFPAYQVKSSQVTSIMTLSEQARIFENAVSPCNLRYFIFQRIQAKSVARLITLRRQQNNPFSSREIQFIFKELLETCSLFEKYDLVHRDLSVQTILIDCDKNGVVELRKYSRYSCIKTKKETPLFLIDSIEDVFEISNKFDGTLNLAHPFIDEDLKTSTYKSPEFLKAARELHAQKQMAYSVGLILLNLATLTTFSSQISFDSDFQQACLDLEASGYGREVFEIINSLLDEDQCQRGTCQSILNNQQFFQFFDLPNSP